MKIKQAAAETGLTEKAIRLYEQQGLISPPSREVAGRRFREYDAGTMARLGQIAALRRAGFTLEQIRALYAGRLDQVLPAYLEAQRQEIALRQQILAALEGQAPADVAELAALLAAPARCRPLPEPECSFAAGDPLPPLPRTGVWLWHGPLPWRLQGGQLALALLLREQPMTWPALCAACRERQPGLPPEALRRRLQRLQRRGVVREQGGLYTAQCGALSRYDSIYTADQLLDWVGLTQNTLAGRAFFTSAPPMSTSSSAGSYGR